MTAFETPKDIVPETEEVVDIDPEIVQKIEQSGALQTVISQIEQTAIEQTQKYEKTFSAIDDNGLLSLPNELQKLVKTFSIKEVFIEHASKMVLPQFHIKIPANEIFGITENEVLLEKESLLEGFPLSKAGTNIEFSHIAADLYKIDLDETKKEHTPTFVRLDGVVKESVMTYMLDPARKSSRVQNFTARIMTIIGNLAPIPDSELKKYITLILESFTDEQFNDLANNEYTYTDKIKQEIKSHSESFAEKMFRNFLDTDKVFIKPSFTFPKNIIPGNISKDMPKTLYEKEGAMNPYEERIINEIANLENIAFWTRNNDKRGFRINGFINHYPDFIIQTKNGKTVILETKGDHLYAAEKISLGNLWASKSGNAYRYFMVYDNRAVDGAYKLNDFLGIVKDL